MDKSKFVNIFYFLVFHVRETRINDFFFHSISFLIFYLNFWIFFFLRTSKWKDANKVLLSWFFHWSLVANKVLLWWTIFLMGTKLFCVTFAIAGWPCRATETWNISLLVNLEYLKVVFNIDDMLYYDTVIGTDSYKTMTGGLCVAG